VSAKKRLVVVRANQPPTFQGWQKLFPDLPPEAGWFGLTGEQHLDGRGLPIAEGMNLLAFRIVNHTLGRGIGEDILNGLLAGGLKGVQHLPAVGTIFVVQIRLAVGRKRKAIGRLETANGELAGLEFREVDGVKQGRADIHRAEQTEAIIRLRVAHEVCGATDVHWGYADITYCIYGYSDNCPLGQEDMR
jgi:hypothetical protein